jgi:hypothetical protein
MMSRKDVFDARGFVKDDLKFLLKRQQEYPQKTVKQERTGKY